MEFLLGLIVGWLTLPYFLVGVICFMSVFPVLFWGIDIYDDDYDGVQLWRSLILIVATVALFHFFSPFKVSWLIAGTFWGSVASSLGWIAGYFVVGIVYAMLVRWPFYVMEYNKRVVEPALERLGKDPSEDKIRSVFDKYRLDGHGSRFALIMRWILFWPWSLLAWMFTDFLRHIFDGIRAVVGGRFADIARAMEPKAFKELRQRERAQTGSTTTTNS